ncbi:hypothetical protein C5B91_20045 [Haloferax sp. Atlit-10N]|uniref:hypothetical protein n=1 Tax=unclassified Haloferax TaxID=2625095 RepID=UPI000E22C618|nr:MULTISPECIES: hypothetical protein [unclassified Haloferax]RDZ39391.1 hypothetical protein C5B87_19305 [Haloferax sp. Atlit-16N]RDZ53906.1 hypothetical protein C5B91_20045 [Haloferax sp. Atlit-10N]
MSQTGNTVSGSFDDDRKQSLALVEGDDVCAAVFVGPDATDREVAGLLEDIRAEVSQLTGGDLR